MFLAFLKGMGLGGGLIIAIGAQNAFLLNQALRGQYAIAVAVVCIAIDVLLILLGVWGLGGLINSSPLLLNITTLGGVVFLLIYGAMAFQRAKQPSHLKLTSNKTFKSASTAMLATAALSLLNPHVYLDTVVLLGSVGGQLPGNQPWSFAFGACLASFIWFSSLAFSGRLLAPYLQSDKSWRKLDLLIAFTMWIIALNLLYSYFIV